LKLMFHDELCSNQSCGALGFLSMRQMNNV
jgi:hypothetical protein